MKSGKAKKAAPPPPTGPSPWLVYYDRKNHRKQIFCCDVSSSQVKVYQKKIPSLLGNKVLACSHGWLVLYDYSRRHLSLCNSTTFDTVPLPSLEYQLNFSRIDSVVLISSSDSNSLKILLFFENIQSILWCEIGDGKWGEISYSNRFISRTSFLRRVVSCGRKIYARVCHKTDHGCRYERGLFSIEIVEEPFGLGFSSSMSMPFFRGTRDSPLNYEYLLGSCDELFWVNCKWGGTRSIKSLVVKVWGYDEGCWKSLKGVKDRAFFLGESYCLSCQESGGGRIYFTKYKDESLYCYNMEDDSVSVSLPCPDLRAWQLSSPIWIMPKAFASNVAEDDQQCIQENDGTVGLVETSCSLGENGLLEKLDTHVLEDIVNQLTPLDYMNFRCVNRGCRGVAPLANWRRGLSGSSSENLNYTFPLLMFAVDQTDESGLMYKFMDPRIKDNYYMMRLNKSVEDEKTLIHYSDHGCLLTSTGFYVHLHNPFTRSSILSFSFAPRIKENEILFFKAMSSGLLIIISVTFIHGGKVVSVTIRIPLQGQRTVKLVSNMMFNATNINTVHFQDVVLFLGHNGNIGELKLGEEGDVISWKVFDRPLPCEYFHPDFLVECGGELLSVCMENGGRARVLVYKLNRGEWAWERVVSLRDYSLYLSRSSSFSVLTTSPESRNRIYFPSLHGSSGIVFFSLETGKWHSSGGEESLNCFYGSRFQLNSCWIKPHWS